MISSGVAILGPKIGSNPPASMLFDPKGSESFESCGLKILGC
jgi:hypothetical protein